MGVTQLWQILAPVKIHKTLSELKGQTLAVDLSIWVCETQGVKNMKGIVSKPFLRNLFFRVSYLTQLGVNLVFVVEGEAPELKWEAMWKRQQARFPGQQTGKGMRPGKTSRRNFKSCLKECCEMLSILGVPYLQSEGEAEAFCAALNEAGVVDGCLTDDGDAFLYGARTVFRNFTMNSKDPHVESYSMADIEMNLGLDRGKLVGLALLLGCDYLPKGVPGVGPEKAIKMMKFLEGVNILKRFKEWRIDEQCLNSEEEIVRRKALDVSDFPQQRVIDEFLIVKDKCPRSIKKWKRPMGRLFQIFASKKLEWPEEYSLEKVLCLITLWDMLSIKETQLHHSDQLLPHRIVKVRVRQGVSCYEIEWYKQGGITCEGDYYVTIEEQDLFSECFPTPAEEFQQSLAKKKEKKKGKSKKKVVTEEIESVVSLPDTTDVLTSQLQSMTIPDDADKDNDRHGIVDAQYMSETLELCGGILKQIEANVSSESESEVEELYIPLSQRIQRKLMDHPVAGDIKSERMSLICSGLVHPQRCSSKLGIGTVSKFNETDTMVTKNSKYPTQITNKRAWSRDKRACSTMKVMKDSCRRERPSLDTKPEISLQRNSAGVIEISDDDYDKNEVCQSKSHLNDGNINEPIDKDVTNTWPVTSRITQNILNVKPLQNRNRKKTRNQGSENDMEIANNQTMNLCVQRYACEEIAMCENKEILSKDMSQVILPQNVKKLETQNKDTVLNSNREYRSKKIQENVLCQKTYPTEKRNSESVKHGLLKEHVEKVVSVKRKPPEFARTSDITNLETVVESNRLNFQDTPDISVKSATKIVVDTPSLFSLQNKSSTPGQLVVSQKTFTPDVHYQTFVDFSHVVGLDSTIRTPNMSAILESEMHDCNKLHISQQHEMKNVAKFSLCGASPNLGLDLSNTTNFTTDKNIFSPSYADIITQGSRSSKYISHLCQNLTNIQDSPSSKCANTSETETDSVIEYGEFNLESSLMKSLNTTRTSFLFTNNKHDRTCDSPWNIQGECKLDLRDMENIQKGECKHFPNHNHVKREEKILKFENVSAEQINGCSSDNAVPLNNKCSNTEFRHNNHGEIVPCRNASISTKSSNNQNKINSLHSNSDTEFFDIDFHLQKENVPKLNKLDNKIQYMGKKFFDEHLSDISRNELDLKDADESRTTIEKVDSKIFENSPVSLADRLRLKLSKTSMKSALGDITGKTNM